MKKWVTIIGAILFLAFVGYVSKIFFGPDNLFEQTAEQIIEEKTGVSVDLSP